MKSSPEKRQSVIKINENAGVKPIYIRHCSLQNFLELRFLFIYETFSVMQMEVRSLRLLYHGYNSALKLTASCKFSLICRWQHPISRGMWYSFGTMIRQFFFAFYNSFLASRRNNACLLFSTPCYCTSNCWPSVN